MKRQVVLIGVQKPGGLKPLSSIRKCLIDMRDWAIGQKIPPEDIKIFTDVPEFNKPNAPVLSISDIYDWIEGLAQSWQPADQLLIYFSGHGMVNGGATLWLLPNSPDKDWEAINLDSSRARAVWNKFKHVVFIGDCCATVAPDEQFDEMKGASIFRLIPTQERTSDKVVDFLRAARPGKASLEMIVNGVSVSPYTVQLVTALSGTPTELLDPENPSAPIPLVLRIRKLAEELRTSVNVYLRANGVVPPGSPFDSLVSTTQWISLFPASPLPGQAPSLPAPPPGQAPIQPDVTGPRIGVGDVLTGSRSSGSSDAGPISIMASLDTEITGLASGELTEVQGDSWSSAIPDGYHYETACGFVVNGSSVVSATTRPGVYCEVPSSSEVRVNPAEMELVVIEFVGGGGVMVPAIAGQIGFLQFDGTRLVSLAYEPSGNAYKELKSGDRLEFEKRSSRVRNLRDTLLSVVTGGDFIFANVTVDTISNALREAAGLDLASLLYLAYIAYSSQETKAVIPNLAELSLHNFGFVPFDFKILMELSQTWPEGYMSLPFTPPFPLLTLGWSLLQATNEGLPSGLVDLSAHYRNAAWTQFDATGLELCRTYLERQTESGSNSGGGAVMTVNVETAPIAEAGVHSIWFEQPTLDVYLTAERATAHEDAAMLTSAYLKEERIARSRDDDEEQELTTSGD